MVRSGLLFVLVLLPSFADADTSRGVARGLLRDGRVLLNQGDCEGALDRFTRALAIFPTSYKIDVNLGTALQCLGRHAEAMTRYEQFLDRADVVADRRMIAAVRKTLAELHHQVATLMVSCPEPDVMVSVDGNPVGGCPLRPIHLQPGLHEVTLTKGQRSFSARLTLAGGERRSMTGPLAAASTGQFQRLGPGPRASTLDLLPWPRPGSGSLAPARPIPSTRAPLFKRWWLWTLVGVVVVGAAVGTVVATQTGGSDRLPRDDGGRISLP